MKSAHFPAGEAQERLSASGDLPRSWRLPSERRVVELAAQTAGLGDQAMERSIADEDALDNAPETSPRRSSRLAGQLGREVTRASGPEDHAASNRISRGD